jgi:uncharacterized hydrophobic protein (TIGR00271 family)
MNNASIYYLRKKLKDYLAIKTDMVNHQTIIRDVAAGVDRSWIYYLMLLMAGLIALLGLLTNSVAVVIGAMLISPLMGPIISSGLALTICDLPLARRAFQTITVSVILTLLATAFISFLSPLKEPTAEILARVRPNIYDLFVAVLSGIVGAVALCTKRNYLITATGVAVATAVIPPLSVAGYGLGTGQIMLGLGGFLLFFTNFVAIVLTSDLVFFVMGFRASHAEAVPYSARTRWLVIAVVLLLISIPLVYTLVVDMKKVNTAKRIERVLKKNLNKGDISHLTGYTYTSRQGRLKVRATVNTVSFIEKNNQQQIEAELNENLKFPVDLRLEQILVASDKLPESSAPLMFTSGGNVTPKIETAAELSARVEGLSARAEKELAAACAPFPVVDTILGFKANGGAVQISATLHRDYPLSADEQVILTRTLERSLELPVNLSVNATPLFPEFELSNDGTLSAEAIKKLSLINQLPGGAAGFRFIVKAPKCAYGKNTASLMRHLKQELKVPEANITYDKTPEKSGRTVITLRILRSRDIP